MERQRSFSLKSTKLLLTFTLSSSFLLCFIFYYCVPKFAPLLPSIAHLHFNPCNKTNDAATGENGALEALEATNLSPETFDSSLSGEDVIFADVGVEENVDVSREALDLMIVENEVRENVSSLEVIESGKHKEVANPGNSNFTKGSNSSQMNQYSSISEIEGVIMERIRESDANKAKGEVDEKCEIYEGEWVFDESYPLYNGKSCSYIDEAFSCEVNGRIDGDYMKWRWKPDHCEIPR